MAKLSYRESGVDLAQYQESMRRLPKLMQRTQSQQVLPWANGFAGLFQLNNSTDPQQQFKDPVMVSGTDGVGTKLKVAAQLNLHNSVGIDLVAMCVNDVICAGAKPLFFLDYVAMGKDDSDLLEQIVEGISEGCLQSSCALLGGETAIMPDLYQAGDYDLAGFCVGVVERDEIIDGSKIEPGDVVIGLPSSGFHSNGYSLIRKAVFEHAGLKVDDVAGDTQKTVGEILLQPTKIYADVVAKAVANRDIQQSLHGIAHITGGGLVENIERILPKHVDVALDQNSWQAPPEFNWLQQLGEIDAEEMYQVFNMGIGLAMIVSANQADALCELLSSVSQPFTKIGSVKNGTGLVTGVPRKA